MRQSGDHLQEAPCSLIPTGQITIAEVAPPLEAFMRAVLADPALQRRLGVIENPDIFVTEALAVAQALGLDLDKEMIRARLRPDPLGIGRFAGAPVMLDCWPGEGWLPAYSTPGEQGPGFDWLWFGEVALDEPFYEFSARRAGYRPFNQMFRTRTSFATLLAGADAADAMPLSGLIYHVSRCGSTLLTRMLGSLPGHVALSEPEPFDAVLQWTIASGASDADRDTALRAIAKALGRRSGAGMERLFIKLDSWHALTIDRISATFADVPWVFLHRDPVEVLVSLEQMPGMQSVPGFLPEMLTGLRDANLMAADDYVLTVMAREFELVLAQCRKGGGLVLDYCDLVDAMQARIPAHFGFTLDAAGLASVERIRSRSAKQPDQHFEPDAVSKQAAASERLRQLVSERTDALRRRLELVGS